MISDKWLIILSYTIFKLIEVSIAYGYTIMYKHKFINYKKQPYNRSEYFSLKFDNNIMFFIMGVNALFLLLGHQRHFIGYSVLVYEIGLMVFAYYHNQSYKIILDLEPKLESLLGKKVIIQSIYKQSTNEFYYFDYSTYNDPTNPERKTVSDFAIKIDCKGRLLVKDAIIDHFDPVDTIRFDEFLEKAPTPVS